MFVVSCNNRHTDSNPNMPAAPSPFGIAQAMAMFYGNFDPEGQTSTVTFSSTDSVRTYGEPMAVRPLFHTFNGVGIAQSFVLVTYAVPQRDEKYYCHACAPTLGMAVFTKKGSTWILTSSNRAVTDAGGFGKPPENVELVEIGKNRYAIQIKDIGDGGGERTTVLLVLVPWNNTANLALERIIADDDSGMCGPRGLPCYSNHRTVTFSRNPKADYFDLELMLTGTDLPVSDTARVRSARKVSGVEVLKFENGKYQQVSRSGDLTTIDRVVAEREGLK
jgi:hypothetical protein